MKENIWAQHSEKKKETKPHNSKLNAITKRAGDTNKQRTKHKTRRKATNK
jgi:hypothetical protein